MTSDTQQKDSKSISFEIGKPLSLSLDFGDCGLSSGLACLSFQIKLANRIRWRQRITLSSGEGLSALEGTISFSVQAHNPSKESSTFGYLTYAPAWETKFAQVKGRQILYPSEIEKGTNDAVPSA